MKSAKLKNIEMESGDESSNSSSNIKMDLSLLRQPIKTSVEGFEEVLRAYESGTGEVRKLLSKECDLIFECKVCRNIFRSLTNFISHKRVYCRSSFNSANHFHFASNGFAVQDLSTIIQAEQKSSNEDLKATSGSRSGSEERSKDISGICERLLWKQHQMRNNNETQVNEATKNKQTLMLNRVNDSDVAVFQSILTDNDNSNMKDEINEVHNMINKKNMTVLGPDGKILNLFNSNSRIGSPALSTEESDVTSTTCHLCNIPFDTQKMLKVHMEMNHQRQSYIYQCPACSNKYSSSAAVIRHLSKDHKKSNRRIRLMRDNIIKKRMRPDEVNSKVSANSSREVQKLQQSNGADSSSKDDTMLWSDYDLNGGGIADSSCNTCPSCLKKFDRKAVYTSHVQKCTDSKDREMEKMKKRKAKDGTKVKNLISSEVEENSNVSEEPKAVEAINKRKRKRTNKIKSEVDELEVKTDEVIEDSNDVVDWNLDDEEEKKKIENIKKEIIEDEYKKLEIKVEPQEQHNDDDEDSGLIIDEKAESNVTNGASFKCPQCDKVFETLEKLKTHLTCYHSRQKRFRCNICDYQGYRKKDTLNHLNFVHQVNVTIDQLFNYVETVNKAVDEAEIAKQREIKKGQTKLKRQLARQMQRKKIKDEPNQSQDENEKVEFKAPELPSSDSTPQKPLQSPPMQISPTKSELKSTDDEGDESFEVRRKSIARGSKNLSSDISPESNQRPIRTRVKPVDKDFLYDLSDLLKKEQEAHREVAQAANISGKRELRKRAMSTSVRDMFESPTKPEAPPQFLLPTKSSTDESSPVKNRRMSVFVPSSRPMYTPPVAVPRSPVYRPPPIPTHKNAGVAFKMALKAFEQNKASLYEPKYIQIENYGQQLQRDFSMPSTSTSAASSILQKLTGGIFNKNQEVEAPPKISMDQLCKKFEPFSVTNELDIPKSNSINLSKGENNLMQLALSEARTDVCVLQECSADSTDFNEEDTDSEPKLEIQSEVKKSRGRPRKNAAGKQSAKGQSRLTVFQRLQENKIRKSREQLFHRMLQQQTEEDDEDEQEDNDTTDSSTGET